MKKPPRARARVSLAAAGEVRSEPRAARAIAMLADGKSYSEIARALGASDLNVIKRYVRAVGKRLRETNEEALTDFLLAEDLRDRELLRELVRAFLDPGTNPADKAKLSDSITRIREASTRRREKVGALPRVAQEEAVDPMSLVQTHGFDKVQRLALAMLEWRPKLKPPEEPEET